MIRDESGNLKLIERVELIQPDAPSQRKQSDDDSKDADQNDSCVKQGGFTPNLLEIINGRLERRAEVFREVAAKSTQSARQITSAVVLLE